MTINIVSIVDSGRQSGLGHLKRTRNLINSLAAKNGRIRPLYLLEKDFDKRVFPMKERFLTTDFHDPIGMSRAIQRLCPRPDIMIVDSYNLKEGWVNSLLESHCAGVSLLIDDFNRFKRYACDFILNFNPIAPTLKYKTPSGLERLFGLKYFPLSCAIKKAKAQSRCRPSAKEVLVTMGGADPEDFTTLICRTFAKELQHLKFHIVLGTQFTNIQRILKGFGKQKHYRFYRNLNDLSPLMARCDVAICPASTTAYELAYLGKPAILVPNSEYQVWNMKFFKERFFFPHLGLNSERDPLRFSKDLKKVFAGLIASTKTRQKTFTASQKFFKGDNLAAARLLKRLKTKG